MNFAQIAEVLTLAKERGVGFSLTYCEADDTWYYSIHSVAPSEEWVGKNRDFDTATARALERLRSL